jgi:hypothetical protein
MSDDKKLKQLLGTVTSLDDANNIRREIVMTIANAWCCVTHKKGVYEITVADQFEAALEDDKFLKCKELFSTGDVHSTYEEVNDTDIVYEDDIVASATSV